MRHVRVAVPIAGGVQPKARRRQIAHMGDHTKGGERRRRCEEKGVDHVRRLVIQRPRRGPPPSRPARLRSSDVRVVTISRQSRQVSGNQQKAEWRGPVYILADSRGFRLGSCSFSLC